MPPDLRDDFASADLTLMKGDLNYRRLVGDHLWPPTTPFTEVTVLLPRPGRSPAHPQVRRRSPA